MEEENDGLVVHDEGAYLRVLSPRVCRVSRSAVEACAGTAVRFPGDLEVIMSSFTGLVAMDEDGAVWWLASEPRPDQPSDHG
jgi:toluene monooxygenase system protein D